jgi:TolA-binding protein
VSFNWTVGGTLDLGLVAEEVSRIEPLLTTTNEKGEVEGVKYDRVGVVLINAIKEQQAQIEQLQRENQSLRRELVTQRHTQEEKLKGLKEILCDLKPEASLCKAPN